MATPDDKAREPEKKVGVVAAKLLPITRPITRPMTPTEVADLHATGKIPKP